MLERRVSLVLTALENAGLLVETKHSRVSTQAARPQYRTIAKTQVRAKSKRKGKANQTRTHDPNVLVPSRAMLELRVGGALGSPGAKSKC